MQELETHATQVVKHLTDKKEQLCQQANQVVEVVSCFKNPS